MRVLTTRPGRSAAPPAPGPWVRPADWLAIPTLGAQEFIGLVAVFDHDSNYVALMFAGAYTVDWGDGVVENIASGVQAQHQYAYSSLSAGSICSRGYKQALVRVTPQSEQSLTTIDLRRKHSRAGLPSVAASFWLELHCVLPSATTVTVGGATIVKHGMVERANMSLPAATNCTNLLANCTALQSVTLSLPAATTCTTLLNGCTALQALTLSLPAAITCTNLLRSCTALQALTLSLPAAITCDSLLYSCSALQSLTLSLPAATNCTNLVTNCSALQSLTLSLPAATACGSLLTSCTALQSLTLSLPAATACGSLLNSCSALETVAITGLGNVISATAFTSSGGILSRAQVSGLRVAHTYAGQQLARAQLAEIFTLLGTASGAQTLTITSNHGVADLTEIDRSIAFNKGWSLIE